MQNDTIQINDTNYRVEFNWNAMANFLESEGIRLSEIDKLEDLSPKQVTALIYSGVKEGARIEKKPFDFSIEDFGASLNTMAVADMLIIYRRQTEIKSKVKPAAKKKPRFYQRKK